MLYKKASGFAEGAVSCFIIIKTGVNANSETPFLVKDTPLGAVATRLVHRFDPFQVVRRKVRGQLGI
jgi:hypothetical protein